MQIKIELSGDYYEDRSLIKDFLKTPNYRSALEDFAQHLRKRIKYEDLPEEVAAVLEETRAAFFECLSENDVELDD